MEEVVISENSEKKKWTKYPTNYGITFHRVFLIRGMSEEGRTDARITFADLLMQ